MSGLRCWPGAIAAVVHSPMGLNTDKWVECVGLVGAHSEYGPVWRVRARSRQLVTDMGVVCAACDIPDAWLRPLTPPPAADTTTADKPQPVEAA